MALKTLFKSMKNEGLVVKPLDLYLLKLNDNEESDRAIDINSPSQVGGCLRARYYARKQYEKDHNSIEPRLRRIFDNGTKVHERLQEYLTKQGILLMDEVPVVNDEYNIQGHTDGYLKLSSKEIGILEIKSIKAENFTKLKDAEFHHKQQALTYMYCAEERRKYLRKTYPTEKAFKRLEENRIRYFESRYLHLEDGKRYTKEEKIQFQIDLNLKSDEILFNTEKPIKRVVVLYECKNSQNLKEFCVHWDSEIINNILEECDYLNDCVKNNKIPDREGTKSSMTCRYCNYKGECHIV